MPRASFQSVIDGLRSTASYQEAINLSDAELLTRYVSSRDEVAFDALVHRHGPMVLGVCRRLLANACDAEDAFQATFLVLVRKAPSVLPREKVANWLYGVAYRAAQKLRAASARRQFRERQVQTMPEPVTVAEGLWRDVVPLLDQELSRLPEKYRLPLVLCDLEGRTRTEAADHLRWPEGTVAGRLARGRALLARRLARHGLPVSAGVLMALLAENTASACVPLTLIAKTTRAALGFAQGSAMGGIISAGALHLAATVLQTMLRSRLQLVLMTMLSILALGWAGVLVFQAPAEEQAETTSQDKKPSNIQKPAWADEATAKELQALQGDWKVVGLESDGRKATAADVKSMRCVIKGTQMLGTDPDGTTNSMDIANLNPKKNPKEIDIVGMQGIEKGVKIPGIYKLENGRLTICLREPKMPEKGRPTEFSAEAGSDQGLMILESLDNPPKPEAKQTKPAPNQTKRETMQVLRWMTQGPATLVPVWTGDVVGKPVKLPRYRLEPGQELIYKGEMQSVGDLGAKLRARGEQRVWVVRANSDGSWRLVSRSTTTLERGFQGNPEQEIVSFASLDLFPDGRIIESDSATSQAGTLAQFTRLPTDAAEAVKGWSTTDERAGHTFRHHLQGVSSTGGCMMEAVSEGALDAAIGFTIKIIYTWDAERGVPEALQHDITYVDKRRDLGATKLSEIKSHDAAWMKDFAADAERYFAAEASYNRLLSKQSGTVAEVKAALAKAAADLKSARPGLRQPEFQKQVDTLLAKHEQQAQYLVEEAERRASIIGQPAAEWSTTDLAGKPHALKNYRGRVVILDFWYRSCFWCIKAMPQMNEIAAHFKGQPVAVLGMNIDPKEDDARAVAEKMVLAYPTLKALGLQEKYKVQSFPTLVIIDQEGIVRHVHAGYSAMLKKDVVRLVEGLMNAK